MVERLDETKIFATLFASFDWPAKADLMWFNFNRSTGEIVIDYLRKSTAEELKDAAGPVRAMLTEQCGDCTKSIEKFYVAHIKNTLDAAAINVIHPRAARRPIIVSKENESEQPTRSAFGSLANRETPIEQSCLNSNSLLGPLAHLHQIRLAVPLRAPPAERALGRAALFFSPQDVSVFL